MSRPGTTVHSYCERTASWNDLSIAVSRVERERKREREREREREEKGQRNQSIAAFLRCLWPKYTHILASCFRFPYSSGILCLVAPSGGETRKPVTRSQVEWDRQSGRQMNGGSDTRRPLIEIYGGFVKRILRYPRQSARKILDWPADPSRALWRRTAVKWAVIGPVACSSGRMLSETSHKHA